MWNVQLNKNRTNWNGDKIDQNRNKIIKIKINCIYALLFLLVSVNYNYKENCKWFLILIHYSDCEWWN